MGVETPKSGDQLGKCQFKQSLEVATGLTNACDRCSITGRWMRKGTRKSLLSIGDTDVHLATRSCVGRLPTRLTLTAQTPTREGGQTRRNLRMQEATVKVMVGRRSTMVVWTSAVILQSKVYLM